MGMRQRLGVAACLLADPELLILDEPMNGLDPAGMHEMREMIESFVEEGRTVMLSSHLLDEVERTCDAVAIVDHGHVIRQGTIEEWSTVRVPSSCASSVGTQARHSRSSNVGPRGGHPPHRVRRHGHAEGWGLPHRHRRDDRTARGAGVAIYGIQQVQTSWRTGS